MPSSSSPSSKKNRNRGIRNVLLAGVFWRILTIEMILLVWSVGYRMVAQDASGMDLVWYACESLVW